MNRRLAALLLLSSGLLSAQAVHKFYVPYSGSVSRVEASVANAGWDVTVSYDAVRCAVLCTYRRSHLAPSLPLAVAVIRIYPASPFHPITVVLDPAGLGVPGFTNRERDASPSFALPGRSLPVLVPLSAATRTVEKPSGKLPAPLVAPVRASLSPLRI